MLCKRDDAPPLRRSRAHRALIVAGVLTTLFGSAAFARGVVARSHPAPPPTQPVFEAREHHATPLPVAETPAATPKTPDPGAPPPAPTNHRLDDALATVPPERPIARPTTPVVVPETPADAPCVCRPRTPHLGGAAGSSNAWGPGHDKDGHLATKSRLHTAWGKPLTFDDDKPKCACPRGTVRVRPHPSQNGSTVDSISPE